MLPSESSFCLGRHRPSNLLFPLSLDQLVLFQKKLYTAMTLATNLVKDIAQRKESLEKIEHEAILVEEVGLKGGTGAI